MKKNMKKKLKMTSVYRNAVQLVLVGAVTGLFAGIVLTFFNILAHEGEAISQGVYAFIRKNPVFIPLLVATLLAGAFLLSVAVKISSVVRGCGIPQAEGGTRGVIRFRWWKDGVAMFASCLLSIFMGLSIGAEGPSVLIGACVGDGVASCSHRNEMIKRYQITGGACTGLAVASNAPLTGIIFAFEEAHKRFTPEVFICAFSSVITGVLTRSCIYSLLGLEIQSSFHSFVFNEMPFSTYGFVLIAGILCGLLGVAFYKGTFVLRRLFGKISLKNAQRTYGVRIAIAVLLGGMISLLASDVMGGGHALIESLGTMGGAHAPTTESVFGLHIVFTLLIILFLKMLITNVNVASGIPCGIFIPIIAIGACLGGVLNSAFVSWGMSVKYCDLMVMLCMAAFFATIVKAPLTAIVMICEFTGSFASLLPVIIAVSIGYMIGNMFHTDGIYEELLEAYEHETGIPEQAVQEIYEMTVRRGSIAEKREVRDVLWPGGVRVKEIHRGEERILPEGGTVLHRGDVLIIVCKTTEHEKIKDELSHILGK